MPRPNFSRRSFIKQGSCKAMSSLGLLSSLLNLRMMSNAASETTDTSEKPKALICLFLNGGNDSYNMLVPSSPTEHGNYQALRANLALTQNSLLSLNRIDSVKAPLNNGRSFGINPAMPELQNLFNTGDLAFVSNVGTLVEPTSRDQYSAGSTQLPRGLFAHNFQQMEWQTSVPQGGITTGWMGRMADLLNPIYNTGDISMNLSLAGNQLMLLGNQITPYTVSNTDGAITLTGTGDGDDSSITRLSATRSLMEQSYKNLYEQAFAHETNTNIELNETFKDAFDSVDLATSFPSNGTLGPDLRAVVKSIASQSALGHRRQTYFVELGGFDNHANLLSDHPSLLSEVSQAVAAFWEAIQELGMEDQVTLFTASDFSRTIRSNGQGSDHGWGGHHFVLGGGVDGQKIYGEYPNPDQLQIGAGLDVGTQGRILPSISTDEYFAELALWLGVPQSSLGDVFPNLVNFWSGDSSPIGFMA